LTFEERCVSHEGIYVEHGNQYAEKVSRFNNFEEPHDPSIRRESVSIGAQLTLRDRLF